MLLVLLVLGVFGNPSIEDAGLILEDSAGLYVVTALKYQNGYYYVSDTENVYLYDAEGRYLRKLVQRGQGPHELITVLNLVKGNGSVWAASPHKAIEIVDGEVVDTIKTKGLLRGADAGFLVTSSIHHTKNGVKRLLVTKRSNEKTRWFFDSTHEERKNYYKFNNMVVIQDENLIVYGDGYSNKYYLLDLETEKKIPLKPNLSRLVRYDMEEHGTLPKRVNARRIQAFTNQFDTLGGPAFSFFVEHEAQKLILLSWVLSTRERMATQIHILNTKGESLAVKEMVVPALDQDDQGNLLFAQRIGEEGDFQIIRMPLQTLLVEGK